MPDVPLRTYVEQLDNLIERKQVDEVIAHCRHILSLYPKHLDTYRLLGKALLEKGRHGDAADIFERVLSVVPDDFISHVGMSIVREDEANLEAALWHMERAFEAAPSNGAIQQELCRLYGRRDGVVPSKARLTRGALARMYSQGGLYLQAEAELKAALKDEPERIDLLTVLAQVYWQTDQPAEAAQTSATVLQKLPYSLEANRILRNVFRAQGRPEDGAVYRQRLEAVDPYQAHAANGLGSARVDPSKVQVARLDYVAGMEDSGSPDWLASIGARFEEPASQAGEAPPDWLSGTSAAEAPPAPVGIRVGSGSVPDWLKDLDAAGPAEGTDRQPEKPAEWLKDFGLATSPLSAAASSSDDEPDWLQSKTGPLPAETTPGWMQTTPADSIPASGGKEESVTAPIRPSSLPDWMRPDDELPPAPAARGLADWQRTSPLETPPEEELPDWLKAITAEPLPSAPAAPLAPAVPAQASVAPAAPAFEPPPLAPGEIPAWLQDTAPASGHDNEVPDWLKATSSTREDDDSLPAWLKAATGPLSPAVPAPASAELTASQPNGTARLTRDTPATAADQPDEAKTGDLPAWLAPLAAAAEGAAAASAALAPGIQPPAAPEAALEAEDTPDWMKPAADDAQLAAAQVPDWMKPADSSTQESEPPAWMATVPAAPSLADSRPEAELPPVTEPAHANAEIELPNWMADVAASAPAPNAAPAADFSTIQAAAGDWAEQPPAVELPAFLQPASAEAIARAEQPYDYQADEDDMADSNENTEPPLPADIPDWLKALAPVSPDPLEPTGSAAPPATGSAGAEAAAAEEDAYSWLAALQAQAQANEAVGQASTSDVPDWLAAASNEAATAPVDDTLAASIPPWAEPAAPGPSDTIVSWLANKRVPQAADDLNSAEPPAMAHLADAAPTEHAQAAAPAASAEPSLEATGDVGSMDPDEAFRWLESLAARQGASPDELLGEAASPAAQVTPPALPAEPSSMPAISDTRAETPAAEPLAAAEAAGYDRLPDWLRPEAMSADASQPTELEPAKAEPAAEPTGYDSLPDWLRPTADEVQATMPAEPGQAVSQLADAEPAAEPAGFASLPDWLRPAADEVEATIPAEPEQPALQPVTTEPAAEPTGFASLPDWLRPAADAAAQEEAEMLAEPDIPAGYDSLPDWLRVPAEALPAETTTADSLAPAANEMALVEEQAPASAAESLPDWLRAPEEPAAAEASLPDWLREMEAAMPVEPLEDTAPSKSRSQAAVDAGPASAGPAPVESTPASPAAEAPAQAEGAVESMDADEAMRWLEGLAAQQGAKPDELFTEPEARPLTPPSWITAEQLQALEAEPAAAPEMAAETEPAAAETDEALEWLQGLVAQQAASSEAPAEIEPEPKAVNVAAEMFALTDTAAAAVEGTAGMPAEPEPEAELNEPEPAAELETPEWLKAYVPAEPDALAEPEVPAAPEAPARPVAPAAATGTAGLGEDDRLARLSERLAATRSAREQEIEARFAEQREQQETARRLVQERMEARWAAEAAEAAAAAEARAAAPTATGPVKRTPPVEPVPEAAPLAEAAPEAEPASAGPSRAEITANMAEWSRQLESGKDLPTVIRTLEKAAAGETAPMPVVQLLGDAYVRANHLQKALDTYRQALRRL